jgi:hypothetical protein
VLALLALALPAPQDPTFEAAAIRLREEPGVIVYEVDAPRLQISGLTLRADLAVLRLDAARYQQAIESGTIAPPAAAAPSATREVLPALWSRRFLAGLGLPEDDTLIQSLLLQGDVRVRTDDLEIHCSLLHDQPVAGRLRIETAWIRFAPATVAPNGWPAVLRAALLEEEPDGTLYAEEAFLTTCTDEPAHYGVSLGSLRVSKREDGKLYWQPERGWLQILGADLIRLPTPDFVPGESFFGLSGARLDYSRRYDAAIELNFRGDAKWGGTTVGWNFYPMLSTRRGLPLRAVFDLNATDYRGRWDLFALEDEADDVTGVRRSVGRDSDNRWRARMENVWQLDEAWRAFAIVEVTSDPLVDPEFFGPEWTEREDIASEFALTRTGDDSFGYFRATPRLDDQGATPLRGFPRAPGPAPQTLEELPALDWIAFPRHAPSLPITVEYGASLARLRLRDRELVAPGAVDFLELPTAVRTRALGWTEVAWPLHGGGAFARPGARVSGSVWEDDTPGAEQDSQLAVEAFFETGFALEKRWSDGWAHRVVPQLRLRAREEAAEADVVPAVFDGRDYLYEGQVAELSLRQFFLAPGAEEPWLDLDVLAPFYADATEALTPLEGPEPWIAPADDGFGPVEVRAIWNPSLHGGALDGVRAEGRFRRDLEAHRTESVYGRLTVRPSERLLYGASYYETEGTPDDFAYATLFAGWRFSESWAIGLRQSENFSGNAGVNTGYALQYYGHDFLFEFGYSRRQVSGDSGVYFNVTPRFFFDPYGSQRLARLRFQ